MARRDNLIHVTSTSPVEMVVKRPLRFPVPRLADAIAKDGFEFYWAQLQVIFDFADPAKFPELPTKPTGDDLRVLERFATKSRDLATSTVLNADGDVSISVADDGQSEQVTSNLPAPDAIAGFAAVFRQFYADERAGFKAASGILMRAALDTTDGDAGRRIEELKLWGRSVGALKSKSVERLVHEYLATEGLFPALPPEEAANYPDLEIPQQAISAYFYGEHLHWGDKSIILDQRAKDPVNEALFLLGFLTAASGLSHVFIGYGVLIDAALGKRIEGA
jgi:hypothetical protein